MELGIIAYLKNLDFKNQAFICNYIINLLKISEDELTKIIKNFKHRFGNTLDIFKKVIRGVPAEEQKIFDTTDILSVNYQSILNWKRFIDWKNDEDKKFEIYNR
mgnify:CR=1 FL=1